MSFDQKYLMILPNIKKSFFFDLKKKHLSNQQKIFEDLVRQIEPAATFSYLSSFRRTRVQTTCEETGQQCIQYLHNYRLYDSIIKCYLAPVGSRGCWRVVLGSRGCWRVVVSSGGCWRVVVGSRGCWRAV